MVEGWNAIFLGNFRIELQAANWFIQILEYS